jgi:hypothetical protein
MTPCQPPRQASWPGPRTNTLLWTGRKKRRFPPALIPREQPSPALTEAPPKRRPRPLRKRQRRSHGYVNRGSGLRGPVCLFSGSIPATGPSKEWAAPSRRPFRRAIRAAVACGVNSKAPLSGRVSDGRAVGAPIAKGVTILLSPPPSRKTRASEQTLGPTASRCGTSASRRRGRYRASRAYRFSWSPGWGSSSPA